MHIYLFHTHLSNDGLKLHFHQTSDRHVSLKSVHLNNSNLSKRWYLWWLQPPSSQRPLCTLHLVSLDTVSSFPNIISELEAFILKFTYTLTLFLPVRKKSRSNRKSITTLRASYNVKNFIYTYICIYTTCLNWCRWSCKATDNYDSNRKWFSQEYEDMSTKKSVYSLYLTWTKNTFLDLQHT